MSDKQQQHHGPGRGILGGNRPGGLGSMMGRGPAEKPKNFKKTLKQLTGYMLPHLPKLITVTVFAILSTVFTIVGPKIMGQATTKLFEGLMAKYIAVFSQAPVPRIDFIYIGRIVVILIVLYFISSLFRYIQQYQMAGVSQKIVHTMRQDINIKLTKLPLQYFDSQTHGEIMSRVTNDINNISTTLQQSMTQLITSLCTIIGILIMMLTISPWLTLITLVTLPVSLFITSIITKTSQKNFAAQQKVLGNLNGHVEEMYTGHQVVKAFGKEKESIKEFKRINKQLYNAAWRAQFVTGIIMPILNFINNFGYVLICVVGGIMTAKKMIDIGDIQAFIQYTQRFTMPITQTASIANILQSTIASAERVFEVLDETEEIPDAENAVQLNMPGGAVCFNNVRFGYSEDRILMKDLNLTAEPGHTIAIVGPTGAGKTTLVNLLMRFYEIQDGSITVDGIDIRTIKRGELRTIFGMVLQDTWLFNGTIMENIAYGKEGATEEEIYTAATAAHADHFIRALPQGYGTILNEEATNISQGERQLLTIARAILANPVILILDEATSSVDTRTEVFIQKAMDVLMKGRTSFIIAHRLSTIRDAEQILVMNEGEIIETGNHKQLLDKNGFYADLYNSQFMGAFTD